VKLDGDYVAPRQLRTNQYNNFKRHGVIGSDPEKLLRNRWILLILRGNSVR